MNSRQQFWFITGVAALVFAVLRSLPDTHCAFLHSDHQPVVVGNVEFCGVNEEANYYQPKVLQFPVGLDIHLNQSGERGTLKLVREDGTAYLNHEVAVTHTEKVHLHLRQLNGRLAYIHLHPVAQDDGTWTFTFPADFMKGNPGGSYQAFVDFADQRSGRILLAEHKVEGPRTPLAPSTPLGRNQLLAFETTSRNTGDSCVIRVKLSGPEGSKLKLQPIMGSLGHAVLMGPIEALPGYAHMHPSLEGGEYSEAPTLAFKLKLPPPGVYDFWLNISDGRPDTLHAQLTVTR